MVEVQAKQKNKKRIWKKHKQRKKGGWFFKLKIQFITAIGISIILSLIVTTLVLVLSSTLIESYFEEYYEFDEVLLDRAYEDIEWLIVEGALHPDDMERLDELFFKHNEFDFSVTVVEKGLNENEALIDYMIYAESDSSLESEYYENDHALFLVSAVSDEMNTAFGIVILGVLIIFVGVFVGCISFFVGRKQKYLLEIENGLELLAGGDLNHKIRIKGTDEITSVAMNINEMSDALKEKIDQEKAIEQTKNELIANISHDLRTPLTSITGFLTLLKGVGDKNSLQAIDYIDVALNKSTELAKLIEQLFDYVMLSNNQMRLNFELMDMSLVMKQSCFECKSLLEEDDFIVDVEIEKEPAYVSVDTGRFMRVMNNLIQNIRKYANRSMVIEVKALREGDQYRIHLVNGLREGADMDRDVFTRYFTSNRTDQQSVGLGLAICREIVQHHSGSIEASVEDNWFEIVISLPILN